MQRCLAQRPHLAPTNAVSSNWGIRRERRAGLTISLIRVSPGTWRRRRADSGSSNRQDHSDLQAVSGPNATTARYFWARWNWGTKRNTQPMAKTPIVVSPGLWSALARYSGAGSEERRVGKEYVSTCRSRWSHDP